MFDDFNKTEIAITDIASATAAIITSDHAGEWVTIQVDAGGFVSGTKFINIRAGQIVEMTAFGSANIDKCDTVKMKYFSGNSIETVFVKSSLKRLQEFLGVTNKTLLKEKELSKTYYAQNGQLMHRD